MASGKAVAFCVWLHLSLGFILSVEMQSMESQFERCCGLGTSWAAEGLKCESFIGPVSGVPPVEQGLCLSAVDICCVRLYHERQCELGKSDARAGLACAGNSAPGGEYHRDCCEGCKLGILTRSMGQGCAFKRFAFGKPWDPAFLECCHEDFPSTIEPFTESESSSTSFNSTLESSVITSSVSPTPTDPYELPTPRLDDLCVLMKGLLCSDICIPSPGSYKCACRDGFTLLEDGKTCRQDTPDDRCNKNNPCEHRCTDSGEAIICSCNPGYVLARDKHSCRPKERDTTPKPEDNDLPAFKCPEGYRYKAANQVCDDIDECAEGTHKCGKEQCFNQPGTYTCARSPIPVSTSSSRCAIGSRYTRKGCEDINECEEIEDACSSNEECINTLGSFTCKCILGFVRDNITQACIDVNECQIQSHNCLPTQRCDNTPGSYTCVRFLNCGTGYTLNAASEICEDDDECALGTHDCSSSYHCRNTPGSYRCEKNSRHVVTTVSSRTHRFYNTIPTTTTRQPILIRPGTTIGPIACPQGFVVYGNQCVDHNECDGPQSPCTPTQRCVNTRGSYSCVSRIRCGPGYKLDESEQRCVDIDECAERVHDCGPGQTCENRPGGYMCTCPPGHGLGPNRDCVDIDECSIYAEKACSSNSRCENTVGSYRCVCDSGFKNVGEISCEDVDECKESPGICQHKCINAWGSYKCACNSGFRLNLDGRSCTDIDECMEFKENNLCVGICQNTPGSYSCQCPKGYRLGSDQRTCQDIDECEQGQVCRDPNEVCQNTRGHYRCNRIDCPQGYHRDTERKNRCLRTSRYCRTGDFECFRSPAHYSYNFITFVSMLPIPPTGQLELFTMRGNGQFGSTIQFRMELVDVRAPPGVQRATESSFRLRRPALSQAVIALTQSLQGPQEIELRLSMEIYNGSLFAGSAVVKLFLFVSEYEF